MRLSLRFILPLLLALGLVAYGVMPLVDRLMLRWFEHDVGVRAAVVANTMQEPLVGLVRTKSRRKVLAYFNNITQGERLFAIGYCNPTLGALIATKSYPEEIQCKEAERLADGPVKLLSRDQGPLHVSVRTLMDGDKRIGQVVLVHDMSFVQRRSEETRRYVFYFFVALGAVVSLITVIIAQLSWRGWVQGIRALLRGEGLVRPAGRISAPELQPITRDLRSLMKELGSDFRPRDESQLTWSPQSLRGILRSDLHGEDILVVSNREPYIHIRRADHIDVQRPASGLVTALEPIMRACSGTWIAHGSGSGDKESVDRHDRVKVPPRNPSYSIRRIWLSQEEEAGYYNGFANEGLWPLCHIAHVRPTFRAADWEQYVAVNRKFARAVMEEAGSKEPIVLVQDYHLALLPRMVREELPKATIISFWHIPWPNPEAFAICPWRAELLEGMLGSSIMGFHTQFHCNNFVDTVDRLLEARVDRETFTIYLGGKPTAVKRYPISIEWPSGPEAAPSSVAACRREVRERLGLPAGHALGVGVDRLDYTKGILERFMAVERLLELQPEWVGRFTFVQVAAPSRSGIGQYQEFEKQVLALADSINLRFSGEEYPPIILKIEHHEPEQVYEHYRAADLCFVSSLHDGMNLVAKEFIAMRDDEQGVLILSQFTGASRELPEALIVNPYDIDQCALALHVALTMPSGEQRDRMRSMRALVSEFNVYRWAGRMLLDGAAMRKRKRLAGSGRAAQRVAH
ncbi:MAG: trehalose-6-phosphate synthase [Betaproteobacteria bacterium RIFCSPLOWO2_02_FULL_63_19]|nr:MAG: trehalose-6-phosphate synthase [Betaproteobacteria bacterium RIFCSPLOWO2_02_FULL_63_19]